jgi:cell division protein FtsW
MIFSASPTMGIKVGDAFYYIKRQLFYLILGFLALYWAWQLDLEKLKNFAEIIFLFSFLFLLLVFIPGVGRKALGAVRWIDLGLLSFQPSELIKFSFLLYLAKWLTQERPNFFQKFVFPVFLLGVVTLPIIKQPDLGTALVLGATVLSLLFLAGLEMRYVWGLWLVGGIGVLGLIFFVPYRLRRLMAYLNPWQDPQGAGFQIIQSLLAVGSGGIWGLGLGASRQKFFYLPQQFTDFIFAILCEELGFLGGATVVVLFFLFALRGLRIALTASDSFQAYLAGGFTCWLSFQALINILVVVGLLPTTGIPLPFMSYGGTATIINLFAAGIVLNISKGKT